MLNCRLCQFKWLTTLHIKHLLNHLLNSFKTMSLSQKFSGFSIVPWYNSAEWKRVYHLIFDKNTTVEGRKEALGVLNLWKTRMNLLPSGVEGTLYILEASLIDCEVMNENQCCILYASNIMRFLNICVANRAPVFNFTKTAKSHSIPDWIINIRHDFAHSPKVPSFGILKLALKESFKWLKETYWDPELAVIKDYVIRKEPNDSRRVIKLIANLIVWLNGGGALPAEFGDELKTFGIDSVDAVNFPEVMNELFGNLGSDADNEVKWNDVISDLIFSGCFFINPAWTDTNTVYTYKYISKLIDHLQTNNNLANLISELCRVMNDVQEFEANRIIVARWLNEIFIGLLRQRPLNCKVDLDELKGKGIRFRDVSNKRSLEEVTNLKWALFQNVNDISRKCFNSFMLLCKSYSLKDCNDFFNKLKDAESKHCWQNLQQLDDDFIDLGKSPEVHVSDSTISVSVPSVGMESSEALPQKRKKRWTLVTDPNYEKCPLGVHPSTLHSTMEVC